MKQTIQRIFQELKIHVGAGRYYSMFILVACISFVLTLEPLFFGRVIQELEQYYVSGVFDIRALVIITAVWFAYVIITQVTKYFIWQEIQTRPPVLDYRKSVEKYCCKSLDMPVGTYLGKRIGAIYKVLEKGTDHKLFFLFSCFEVYLYQTVSILSIIVILFLLDVRMALIALMFLPLMIYLGYYFATVTHEKQLHMSKRWENIFHMVGNAFSNFTLFKTLVLGDTFRRKIYHETKHTYIDQMKLNRMWNISEIYGMFLIMLTRVFVLASGIYFIQQGTLTLGELFVIFNYVGWIYFPMNYLFKELRNSVKQLTEVQRMYDEVGNIDGETDLDQGKNIKQVSGHISFQNVSFEYISGKKVLRNIDLHIEPGQRIAFVGNTGAGKSTLVNLLLRFWDISDGTILLDDHNIQEIKKSSLRSHIGVVSQDNSLFNMSIKENLLFACPKATGKQLESALKKAQAHFVFDLKDGLDTIIGERGLKLSGGEKQRLSIARLFLKNPQILILDEATSALDNKTEKLVQKALEALMKGRTSIIIAHRLSTIQHADMIYMLENGKIVESGNYEALMQKKKKFYTLANPDHLIIN